ncbi:MAG: c-type cytochrome [Steroidobacteraceae bacterium]
MKCPPSGSVVATVALLVAPGTAPAQALESIAPPAKAALCISCHGAGGRSLMSNFPNLAGQTARYIYLQLKDFQEGRRVDPLMSPMAAGITRDEMRELADYFAAEGPALPTFKVDPAKAQLGEAKVREALCTMCHLGGLLGQNEIPRLANQHYEYVVKQLQDFRARHRTNDAGAMTSVAGTLSDQDIENIAQFIASL